MPKSERYKLLLQRQYDASNLELVRERAKARLLATEFQKYAGTYLAIESKKEFAEYMKLRKQFLPNLSETCLIDNGFHVDYGFNIYGGANSIISFNVTILDSIKVTLGANVYIGSSVVITDASHPVEQVERANNHGTISKPISIGDNAWLCSNATVCQGVAIGAGAIIAAGAVIRHDVPENAIVVGNDQRIVGYVNVDKQLASEIANGSWHKPDPET